MDLLLRQMSKAGRAAALVTSLKPSLKYGNAPKNGWHSNLKLNVFVASHVIMNVFSKSKMDL